MTTAPTLLRDQLSDFEPRGEEESSPSLESSRLAAFAWIAEHGFPTKKHEDWRYTRLDPILSTPFQPAEDTSSSPPVEVLDELAGKLGNVRLVFVDGYFSPALSTGTEHLIGIKLMNLRSALAEGLAVVEEHLTPLADLDAFNALNAYLARDGAFIQIDEGVDFPDPIHLVYLASSQGTPIVSSPRSLLIAGKHSAATVIETFVGLKEDAYFTNATTEIVLEQGASLEHYKVQNERPSSFHLSLLDVRQAADTTFSSQLISLGSAIARQEVRVHLSGEKANARLYGLFMPRSDQHHDNPTVIDHVAPRCTSEELYKGVIDGNGEGVFNGRVIVREGAFGTDARQLNKNLLLSDHAEIDTRPRLEILADDVQCSHGAAVGQLDEDALFYLRSRGIPLEDARNLLIYAFAHEMLDFIGVDPLKDFIEQLVIERLGTTSRRSTTTDDASARERVLQ